MGAPRPDEVTFTQTELRILKFLSDGLPKKRIMVLAAVDEQCEKGNLRAHLCNINAKLARYGQKIATIKIGMYGTGYQHVRLLHSAAE